MATVPIRCFTCGNIIAGRWLRYNELVAKYGAEADEATGKAVVAPGDVTPVGKQFRIVKADDGMLKTRTPEARAMDELGFERYCCRRMLLASVDITPYIN